MSDVIVTDTITPELARILREIQNRTPIMRAIGQELVSITRQAFTNPPLRPAPWAPLKKASGRPLYRTGALTRSITVSQVSNDSVTVSTDRPYAIFQQLGTKGPYTIRPRLKGGLCWPGAPHPFKSVTHPGLPPRPFFPFDAAGHISALARQRIEAVISAKLRSLTAIR